jgi:hypothetical protein
MATLIQLTVAVPVSALAALGAMWLGEHWPERH